MQFLFYFIGGKIYKVCFYQVVCGFKYFVWGESVCDYVDLFVFFCYWLFVYVVDMVMLVVLCVDFCYLELINQMWGRNQGCFFSFMELFVSVFCLEFLDQYYIVDMIEIEYFIQYLVIKIVIWCIVYVGIQFNFGDFSIGYYFLVLCFELVFYVIILVFIVDSKLNSVCQWFIVFDNVIYYYFYNWFMDFFISCEIVNCQIYDIVQSCQFGEVVICDIFYCFGVVQIKIEIEEEGEEEEVVIVVE